MSRKPVARSEFAGSRWTGLIGGLAYAVATYLSFPPAGLWPLSFVGVAALIWAGCKGSDRPLRSGLLAAAGSLPLWLGEQAWLLNVTPVGYPLLAIYLALWSGAVVWMIATVRASQRAIPMSIAAPLIWVAVEMLRGELVLTGYAWFLGAQPLIENPHLALPARLLGVYVVSFLIAALMGSLADAAGWTRVSRRLGGVGAGTVVLVWVVASLLASGQARPAATARTIKVGIVQTNIAQGQKLRWSSQQQAADFQRFLELTRAARIAGAEIVLWPETMFPGYALNEEALVAARSFAAGRHAQAGSPLAMISHEFADALVVAQRELRVPMIVGAEAREGMRTRTDASGGAFLESAQKYNSAIAIADGKVLDARYDKVDLTPFGEVIPYVWRWPKLEQFVLSLGAGGMKFDLSPGERAGPIALPMGSVDQASSKPEELRVATPICFEVTRSSLCRRLVYGDGATPRADLIVNLSNDGWFGSENWWFVPSDAGRRQHLLAARWRSLELGVPMVRAVNTGISCAVDTRGQLTSHTTVSGGPSPTRSEAALIAMVSVGGEGTLYGRIGNVFGWLAMAGGLLLVAFCLVSRRTPSRERS